MRLCDKGRLGGASSSRSSSCMMLSMLHNLPLIAPFISCDACNGKRMKSPEFPLKTSSQSTVPFIKVDADRFKEMVRLVNERNCSRIDSSKLAFGEFVKELESGLVSSASFIRPIPLTTMTLSRTADLPFPRDNSLFVTDWRDEIKKGARALYTLHDLLAGSALTKKGTRKASSFRVLTPETVDAIYRSSGVPGTDALAPENVTLAPQDSYNFVNMVEHLFSLPHLSDYHMELGIDADSLRRHNNKVVNWKVKKLVAHINHAVRPIITKRSKKASTFAVAAADEGVGGTEAGLPPPFPPSLRAAIFSTPSSACAAYAASLATNCAPSTTNSSATATNASISEALCPYQFVVKSPEAPGAWAGPDFVDKQLMKKVCNDLKWLERIMTDDLLYYERVRDMDKIVYITYLFKSYDPFYYDQNGPSPKFELMLLNYYYRLALNNRGDVSWVPRWGADEADQLKFGALVRLLKTRDANNEYMPWLYYLYDLTGMWLGDDANQRSVSIKTFRRHLTKQSNLPDPLQMTTYPAREKHPVYYELMTVGDERARSVSSEKRRMATVQWDRDPQPDSLAKESFLRKTPLDSTPVDVHIPTSGGAGESGAGESDATPRTPVGAGNRNARRRSTMESRVVVDVENPNSFSGFSSRILESLASGDSAHRSAGLLDTHHVDQNEARHQQNAWPPYNGQRVFVPKMRSLSDVCSVQ